MKKPHKLSVRRAEKSDLDAVANVWHESALGMDGPVVDVPTPEALRHRVEAELRSEWELYVAVRGEWVVGMLALKPVPAILDQIFVAPREQGKGIGKALLDVAKQRMGNGFTLRMAAANEKAHRFYEAEGLKKLGEGIHPWTGVPVQFYGWNVL